MLTPVQAVELDRATQARGVSGELLMERAGRAVARGAVDLAGGVYGRRALVVCGTGNNGGDGLVAARCLSRWGMGVTVAVVGSADAFRGAAATNLQRLRAETTVRIRGSQAAMSDEPARADVAIDGIFGTGFHGVAEGEWAAAIDGLNEAEAPAIAIDIASGIDGATGSVTGAAVWADLTVTFGAAKIGAVLMPGAERSGAVRVVDIGLADEPLHAGVFLIEPGDVAAALPRRAADSHKRASGVLLVVAGSRTMTGAAQLIAEAAMRAGAGLVISAVPEGIMPVVQTSLTEAVFLELPETEPGTVAAAALEPVLEALERADALAVGPGLTTQEETGRFVRDLVRASPVPVVLDADGLNAFARRAEDLADCKADVVLTPHIGELGRLSGVSAEDLEADRLAHARGLAARTNAVALLKGSRTVIAEPDGRVRINATGSSILSTAGSGDVLTGITGGLLARGLAPVDAAASAAYLHGVAGRIAGVETGEGTLAGDLVRRVPDAVAAVMQR